MVATEKNFKRNLIKKNKFIYMIFLKEQHGKGKFFYFFITSFSLGDMDTDSQSPWCRLCLR